MTASHHELQDHKEDLLKPMKVPLRNLFIQSDAGAVWCIREIPAHTYSSGRSDSMEEARAAGENPHVQEKGNAAHRAPARNGSRRHLVWTDSCAFVVFHAEREALTVQQRHK